MKKILICALLFIMLSACLIACSDTSETQTTAATTSTNGVTTTEYPVITSISILTTTAPVTTAAPVTYSLEGKNYLFLGSSVTYGSASGGYSMADCLKETEGCKIYKEAVSGTTLVNNGSSSYVQRLILWGKKAKNTKYDHVIVQLSTNDATQNKPLGKVSESCDKKDFDTPTVAGAIEYIIAFSKETWNCHVSFYTGTKYDNANYKKMVDLLYDIGEKWGIGIIDLYNDPEMNAVSKKDYAKYMANNGTDGIHPTKLGYIEWWTPKFKAHLEKYE